MQFKVQVEPDVMERAFRIHVEVYCKENGNTYLAQQMLPEYSGIIGRKRVHLGLKEVTYIKNTKAFDAIVEDLKFSAMREMVQHINTELVIL